MNEQQWNGAFSAIRAEESLKEETLAYLARRTHGYRRSPVRRQLGAALAACLVVVSLVGGGLFFTPAYALSVELPAAESASALPPQPGNWRSTASTVSSRLRPAPKVPPRSPIPLPCAFRIGGICCRPSWPRTGRTGLRYGHLQKPGPIRRCAGEFGDLGSSAAGPALRLPDQSGSAGGAIGGNSLLEVPDILTSKIPLPRFNSR